MATSWIVKNKEDIQKVITIKEDNGSLHIYVDFTLCSESIREFLNLHIEELVDDGIGTYENGTIIILDKNRQRLDDDLLSLLNISQAVQNTENQKKVNEMVVVAEDGTKITLNSDGTWEKLREAVVLEADFDVRKVNWGMSRQEVENIETLTRLEDVNALAYDTSLAGLNALLVYDFFQEELYKVRYAFMHQHTDSADFIADFENIKKNLILKYGSPLSDERYFTDSLYDDIPSEWGSALDRGGLSFFTKWDNNNTDILLSLYGDNHEIDFTLGYRGKKYIDLTEEARQQQLLDDL